MRIQNDLILEKTLNKLTEILNKITDKNTKITWLSDKLQTVLINSNFNAGYYIKRFDLYIILKENTKLIQTMIHVLIREFSVNFTIIQITLNMME